MVNKTVLSDEEKIKRAVAIQRKREADELANHVERLEWLSGNAPCWSDGTPVDAHTRNTLLTQSRDFIANHPKQ